MPSPFLQECLVLVRVHSSGPDPGSSHRSKSPSSSDEEVCPRFRAGGAEGVVGFLAAVNNLCNVSSYLVKRTSN